LKPPEARVNICSSQTGCKGAIWGFIVLGTINNNLRLRVCFTCRD